MNILFVCTGNTCRSPMAEFYLKAQLERSGKLSCHQIASAGMAVFETGGLSAGARQALEELGIAVPDFSSRQLTEELFTAADRVYCMSDHHRECLAKLATPEEQKKLFTLLDHRDVPDPFGGDAETYRRCLAAMRPALDRLSEEL